MEHLTGSDYPTVYHGPAPRGSTSESGEKDALRNIAFAAVGMERVRVLTGGLPRLFALVQGFEEEGAAGVVAYGLEMPCGAAATVGVVQGFGRWRSAYSAASRLHSDLVWLGEREEGRA